MTGVEELRTVGVVSAAPDQMRVSVLGGRTQLDVALPADIPVAAFLPELARLVSSRDDSRDKDVAARDERRTFWVLARIDGGEVLAPEQTLRSAGVNNGELLRISVQRALSPPTLYDDVVDAAARLNRASYAAWNATAAAAMAFAGLWLCTAALLYFLVADVLSAHRGVMVGVVALTVVTLVGGAALVHHALGLADIATAVGWPAIPLTAGLAWVLGVGHGEIGLAVASAVLLGLVAAYYRVIGTGHFAYIAAAVALAFGCLAMTVLAVGADLGMVGVAAATVASICCLVVSGLTRTPRNYPEATVSPGSLDPFSVEEASSDPTLPRAEEVWAMVRSAVLTRAGLLTGLSAVVVVGASVLLRTETDWPALTFALVCAVVLVLRSRRVPTVPERAALVVPAVVLVLVACALAQAGVGPVRLGGVGLLVGIVVVAVPAGLLVAGGVLPGWVVTAGGYLDYVAVAALVPVAVWPLGIYDRLGLS